MQTFLAKVGKDGKVLISMPEMVGKYIVILNNTDDGVIEISQLDPDLVTNEIAIRNGKPIMLCIPNTLPEH